MTFDNIESFTEWLLDLEEVDVQETHAPGDDNKYVTVENLRNTPGVVVAEVFTSAYDTGLHFGGFFADRYDGQITFRE